MRSLTLLLTFILLFASSRICAQQTEPKIEDNFDNIKLPEFFSRLEKKAPYKFYYDAVQLDTFLLQLSVKDLTLTQVLQQAFKGTDIHYSIDSSLKNIYITRKLSIVTDLPKGYFNPAEAPVARNNDASDEVADFDIETKGKPLLKR